MNYFDSTPKIPNFYLANNTLIYSVSNKSIFVCESGICWNKGKLIFGKCDKQSFGKVDKFVEVWHLVYFNTG